MMQRPSRLAGVLTSLLLVAHAAISFNYTTVLNIIFLAIRALLVRRFLKTGGPHMIRMMDHPMAAKHA
jgi:hypothetical protein